MSNNSPVRRISRSLDEYMKNMSKQSKIPYVQVGDLIVEEINKNLKGKRVTREIKF